MTGKPQKETRGRKPKKGGRLAGDTIKTADLFSDLQMYSTHLLFFLS